MEANELLWDVAAEQSVIGSILISEQCLPEVERELQAGDFRLDANRAIYQAALALEATGARIDPVTILNQAAKMGQPVSRDYMMQLMELTPTAANVGEYIRIVRQEALKAGLMNLSGDIRDDILNHTSPADVIARTAHTLDKLMGQGNARRLSTPADIFSAFYRQREAIDNGDAKGYVCTGYAALDQLLGGGMLNSGLYLLAARPGMGKTTMALNIADRVAQADPVLFVSLEMDDEQLAAKRISRVTGIPSQKLLMQPLSDREYDAVARAARDLSILSFYTNNNPVVTVEDIGMLARGIGELRLIVVDYFGKIAPPAYARRAGRVEYTTEISGALKNLARALKIPVLVLCQLNREVEARQDKHPQLSDLRDTGALEQDADGVIFLYRSDYYADQSTVNPNAPSVLEVNLAKNRHGFVGSCKLAFSMASSQVTTMLPEAGGSRPAEQIRLEGA